MRTIAERCRIAALPIAMALVVCAGAGGCKMWNPRGEGFPHAEANYNAGVRSKDPDGDRAWGFDERARQVERNLGKH